MLDKMHYLRARTQVLTSTKASHSHVRVKVPGGWGLGSREGQHNLLLLEYYSLSRVHPGRTASWYLRPIPTYMQVVLCTYFSACYF